MSKATMTSALFVVPSSTTPATNWYSKRAHAHFATYFGAGAFGVNG
jgi:hypothetical protein